MEKKKTHVSPICLNRQHILDSSKLKEFAEDNFKFDENGRKLSKRVENTEGKEEIARYEQFLLFPQCFQKACFRGASKGVVVWEWVNPLPDDKILDWSKLKADDNFNEAQKVQFQQYFSQHYFSHVMATVPYSYTDSTKKVYMRKEGDLCEKIYLNSDIFGTK